MNIVGVTLRLFRLAYGNQREWKFLRYWLKMKRLGVDLESASLAELKLDEKRSCRYTNSGGWALETILDTLKITSDDVALDMGCGKGGAMITMAQYPFSRVDGVELSPDLAKIAEQNMARAGAVNTKIWCTDAAEITDLDDYTVLYMYNPFPEVVLHSVLENLRLSLQRREREIRFLYKNPVHSDLVLKSGFTKSREFDHGTLPVHLYTATNLLQIQESNVQSMSGHTAGA